ncbi:TPA: restriction endonuclease subunit S [Klebsiella pneumoniae]|uniref:restriction endonuclease subunit S n=1 Tax=Klebsiella pneumoniae complex TaxID=3390273 RepID=UPI00190D146C|nr:MULTISPECIES: restriction endonuclease subunit S [Klebsiella]EJK1969273.1 restriction endonuclease subunit S [Salmonella enterica]HCQ0289978.1 restriction endonuclease subunit S [Escherichia coli]EJK6225814.1 restriction endonuclease subunit S [Salmonella enterica]MBV0691064.1 restriction endonuclease subunit S [Klebsiella quasipneumoniae]MCE0177787.1 restriction endonuclease subunit S [Klebsiella pneumoniae]
MSEMSYLEKLLDGVEVEWLSLSKVFNLRNGYTPSKTKKEFWENGDIPWFRMDDIRENGRILGNSLQRISSCAVKGGKLFPENSILISTSATIGEHALITVPHLANQRFTCLALKESYVDCFDIKFLFYYCFSLAEWCRKNTTMSSFASVDMDGFKKFLIPLPCPDNPEKSLAIQSEIVRILDKFTALTAELTAELTARKKQYNYYRDRLLSFEEGEVEWKTLGEVAVIGTGNHDTQDAIEHGKYIFYARGREPLKLNVFDFDETAIITAGDGAGVGKVFHYAKGKYALHQRAYRIVPNAFMNPRFVYHYITAYFFTYIQKASVSSSVTSLRRPMFLKFPIPVPPSEEQARIVEILDKFDTLTNSITEGLPREIELRQKQYEYYRDLLFSFPKPDSVTN